MEKETTSEVIEITLEAKIEHELVKHNVTQAVLASLKDRFGGMKLRGLTDTESFLELKEAKKEVSKVRNLAVKCCKALRDDAIKYQKTVVAKENEIVAEIKNSVEDNLDAQIELYNAEKERLDNEEKRLQEEAYMHRTQSLTKMGAVYSEGSFTLGAYSIEANMIKESSADTWNDSILPKFDAEYQKIEADRIEQQKKKDIEEAELKRKQAELAEKERLFNEQQAAFQKQQDEQQRLEREKKHAEELEAERVRVESQNKRLQQLIPFNPYNKNLPINALWSLSEEQFIEMLNDTKAKHEVEQADNQRKIEEQAALKERQRIEEENRLNEIKRQQEEQRKAEELAKAGDTAQWDNFIEQVKKITVPAVKSGQYRKISAIAKEKLEEILNLKP